MKGFLQRDEPSQ